GGLVLANGLAGEGRAGRQVLVGRDVGKLLVGLLAGGGLPLVLLRLVVVLGDGRGLAAGGGTPVGAVGALRRGLALAAPAEAAPAGLLGPGLGAGLRRLGGWRLLDQLDHCH